MFEAHQGESLFHWCTSPLAHYSRKLSIFEQYPGIVSQLIGVIAQEAADPVLDGRGRVSIAQDRQAGGHGFGGGHVVPCLKLGIGCVDVETVRL